MKSDFSKIGSAPGGAHGHHAIVLEERLEMPVRLRFLPERVDLGRSAFFNHDAKTRGLDLEEFHCRIVGRPCRTPQFFLRRRFPERPPKESPPENYGKEDQTTVAAFLL